MYGAAGHGSSSTATPPGELGSWHMILLKEHAKIHLHLRWSSYRPCKGAHTIVDMISY
jgi:hypothetical protein